MSRPTFPVQQPSILESLFKVYIEDNCLELPADQSLKPLWRTVSKHIGFDPCGKSPANGSGTA
jgi:hypothetical protein